MVRTLFAAALVAAISLTAVAADAPKYTLTGENTKVTFVGKKPDGKHEGGFAKLTGTAIIPDGDLTKLKVEAEIDTTSIHSDDAKLTEHLKSPDFFDVKNHPKATFKSTKVEKNEKDYSITGDLTILGKTKSIKIPALVTEKNGTFTIAAAFEIDRTDWGMTYGKGKIEDKVVLGITVVAKK